MKIKYLKQTIILLLVLLIIVFICILILNIKTKNKTMKIIEGDRSQDFIKEMGMVNDYSTFFSVEKMLNNYIAKVASKNVEATLALLDNTYLTENDITEDNIINKMSEIIKYDKARIRKIYSQENERNAIYIINCILEKNYVGKEYYFVLYEDMNNLTYSIKHIDKDEYEKEITLIKEELEEKEIEKNAYNKTEVIYPSEEERVNKYFIDFLANAVYYPEYIYSILNEEYKNKRFPTLQDFEEYINERKDLYSDVVNTKKYSDFNNMDEYMLYLAKKQKLQLKGYQIRYLDEYTRYICIDNYNNYYIFYAEVPFNYKLVLDTYTIDLPEFIEKYNIATTEEKVMLNIQKTVEALNKKDYNYIYSVLADEFKANYFKTYEEFEKYAENTFDIENKITYNNYTESDELCTYKVTLNGKNKTITKTIVMRLDEGTNFVMSFNVN